MHRTLRIFVILLCLFMLILVRFRESALFYDPLISFFYGDYQSQPLPGIEWISYVLNIFLRYVINMLLSVAILWLAFKDRGIVKFSMLLYTIMFCVLMSLFVVFWHTSAQGEYMALFYVRRFLIQPLLIFMLLPAFYYYRRVNP
ncbi:MAG: exosortase F-associated protein [Flavobacteriales bacterium]|jgi:exosortase F-associated protein